MYRGKRPYYKHRSIRSAESLCLALQISLVRLTSIAKQADNSYRLAHEIKKPDGTIRRVFDAREPLKYVQKKINNLFLKRVQFPYYLQGGIRDPEQPRHYVANVGIHSGSEILIREDIADFFSTTQRNYIYSVWRGFFGFSEEVSELLTAVTTKDGVLPQGAPTSTLLANLVFWDTEPSLVEKFEGKGLKYSRFVDDIAISSPSRIGKSTQREIIGSVYGMMHKKRLLPKRGKHSVMGRGGRMVLNNLVANRRNPSLPKEERSRIRAAVYEIETWGDESGTHEEFVRKLRSAYGRVRRLGQFHPQQSTKFLKRLDDLSVV